MPRNRQQIGRLAAAATVCFLAAGGPASATVHTLDIIELPGEGGTQVISDGSVLDTFPGSETGIIGVNNNDGNYTPQVINVDLYDDAAHTIVSDRVTITIPVGNPPQITEGLTSDTDALPLLPQVPEDIALTETGALQTLVTLINDRGNSTIVGVQSDAPEPIVPAPEPSALVILAPGLLGLLALAARRRAGTKVLLRDVAV